MLTLPLSPPAAPMQEMARAIVRLVATPAVFELLLAGCHLPMPLDWLAREFQEVRKAPAAAPPPVPAIDLSGICLDVRRCCGLTLFAPSSCQRFVRH